MVFLRRTKAWGSRIGKFSLSEKTLYYELDIILNLCFQLPRLVCDRQGGKPEAHHNQWSSCRQRCWWNTSPCAGDNHYDDGHDDNDDHPGGREVVMVKDSQSSKSCINDCREKVQFSSGFPIHRWARRGVPCWMEAWWGTLMMVMMIWWWWWNWASFVQHDALSQWIIHVLQARQLWNPTPREARTTSSQQTNGQCHHCIVLN